MPFDKAQGAMVRVRFATAPALNERVLTSDRALSQSEISVEDLLGVRVGSVEDKETVKRLFAAFDALDFAAMDELLSADFVAHGLAPQFSEDVAGWKDLAAHWSAGFSDEELTLEGPHRRGRRGRGPLDQPMPAHRRHLRYPGDPSAGDCLGNRNLSDQPWPGHRVLGRAQPQRSVRRARNGFVTFNASALADFDITTDAAIGCRPRRGSARRVASGRRRLAAAGCA